MTCQFHMISAELKSRSLKKCFIEYKNRRKLFCSQGVKNVLFCKTETQDDPELLSIVFILWHLKTDLTMIR